MLTYFTKIVLDIGLGCNMIMRGNKGEFQNNQSLAQCTSECGEVCLTRRDRQINEILLTVSLEQGVTPSFTLPLYTGELCEQPSKLTMLHYLN